MDDLISRQAAIDALENQKSDWNYDYNVPIRKSIELLVNLPSAEPERKKGKWICNEGPYELYKCSSCGKYWLEWYTSVGDSDWMSNKLKFCPNCGADMRGENR